VKCILTKLIKLIHLPVINLCEVNNLDACDDDKCKCIWLEVDQQFLLIIYGAQFWHVQFKWTVKLRDIRD